MRIRRGPFCGLITVTGITLLNATSALAAPPEKSLLGIPLLSRHSAVLKRFGQPHEIQVGAPTVTDAAQGGATASASGSGGATGGGKLAGITGVGGGMGAMMPGGGMPGGAMMQGMRMGAMMSGGGMGGGMPSGAGGGPPAGFNYNNYVRSRGFNTGGSGGGLPGMAGAAFGAGGGIPGMGRMAGMGAGPASAGGGAGASGAEAAAPETTWWYHDKNKGRHYSFLFNKDGQVIQIQMYGWDPDKKMGKGVYTAQGITLGSTLKDVVKRYGWSNQGTSQGKNIVLTYGAKHQVAFQLVDNKVAGIVLGLVN